MDTTTLKINNREKLIDNINSHLCECKGIKISWETLPNMYTTISNDFAFRLVCQSGDIEVAQCLYEIWSIEIDMNYAFRIACQYGHLHIAKWLHELEPKIDIHEYNDFAISFARNNGHTEVVKWLSFL